MTKELQYGPCGLFCGACGEDDCTRCGDPPVDDTIRNCKFRNCSRDKKLEFCCFCSEYPCKELLERMNDQWPHHWTQKSNLEYIKKNGKEKWLQVQRKEWACKICGTEIKWYQKKCNCGQILKAWNPPATI
jgi:hypothetical protein